MAPTTQWVLAVELASVRAARLMYGKEMANSGYTLPSAMSVVSDAECYRLVITNDTL